MLIHPQFSSFLHLISRRPWSFCSLEADADPRGLLKCPDITFSNDAKVLDSNECTNSSNVGGQPLGALTTSSAGTTTPSGTVPTPSSEQPATKASGELRKAWI